MVFNYEELFFDPMQELLAESIDYAVMDLKISLKKYWEIFLGSKLSKAFSVSEPKYVLGYTGPEFALEVLDDAGLKYDKVEPSVNFSRSSYYWVGYILTHFIFEYNISLYEVDRYVSIDEIHNLYNPLHEAPEKKFCEILLERINSRVTDTNLARIRKSRGISQSKLSKLSNVSLRAIQQYEQRVKDINKANFINIINLSRSLYCEVDELLEKKCTI